MAKGNKLIPCKHCGAEIAAKAKSCPHCGGKNKKPIFKKWWFWLIMLILFAAMIPAGKDADNKTPASATASQDTSDTTNNTTDTKGSPAKEKIPSAYKSALNKAKTYSDTMHMSKAALYDQLTSEYGEKFSQEAAQYAIDNLVADWNVNALEKAKTYQKSMNMSPSAIHDQLTSAYGEKFTEEEADYAIENLE